MSAEEIIQRLDLEPHPEGGFYREIYRSDENLSDPALPNRYEGKRSLQTAIYYLLTSEDTSKIHRLQSDEVFHFYQGDPVHMLLLHPDGRSETTQLGNDIINGQRPQRIIPRGTWFGLYLEPDADYALMGTTVAPGFDFDDFELGNPRSLIDKYPENTELIRALS